VPASASIITRTEASERLPQTVTRENEFHFEKITRPASGRPFAWRTSTAPVATFPARSAPVTTRASRATRR
jgi:hypothetical protein